MKNNYPLNDKEFITGLINGYEKSLAGLSGDPILEGVRDNVMLKIAELKLQLNELTNKRKFKNKPSSIDELKFDSDLEKYCYFKLKEHNIPL